MNDHGEKLAPLRFGPFELDPAGGELRKSGILIKLQTQQLQLLALLAGRAGEIITREEIRRALWGGETFVDFDRSINLSINKVRDALGDDPQSPRYIETLPRKGYRFIAPVVESGNELPAVATAIYRPGATWWWWLIPAGIAVLTVGLAVTAMLSRSRAAKPIQSLAVLPFENLSADPEQQYFADGMTDDLITDLARISTLRVISRTSVMQYKSTKKPIPEIARELNVDALLEGTVTRDGDRVRITVQLIRADPEKHLWADRYEEGLGGMLALQDNVAKAVAREIRVKVTPQEQAALDTPRTVDPEAYEAYLKGRYFWQPGGEKNLAKSLDYFQQAIQKDPSYALAWTGVADAYNRLADWGVVPWKEAAPRTRAAAEKALDLDPSLVGPIVTLASVKMWYEWDWAGAERLCKQAIQLSPNSGLAHSAYSLLLAVTGRIQEAVTEERQALQADPLDSVFAASMSWRLYLAHNYEEAERNERKWYEWHPQYRGDYITASIYLQTGRTREALEEFQLGASENHHQTVLELMYLGHALGVTGAHDDGRKVLAEMLVLSHSRYVPPDYIAMVYEGLGDRERALQWYEKAVNERSMNIWVLPDQRLDAIRSDPRFQRLMRRMGLPQ